MLGLCSTLTDRDNHVVLASDDGGLPGVFTDIERAFDYDTNDIGWLRFAASERLIVTARLHPCCASRRRGLPSVAVSQSTGRWACSPPS